MAWQTTGRVLVVGLGNPGPKYVGTRHNIGFMLAEALAHEARMSLGREKFNAVYDTGEWQGRPVVILLPQTFMNLSGQSVSPALSFFDLDSTQMVVLHDEIDLPPGDVRVKEGGGHGGHNGLRSIVKETGRRDFIRIRLGVGRPTHGNVTSHVLGRFSANEEAEVEVLIERGLLALEKLFVEGPKAAMNAVNGLYRAERSSSD